MSEKQLGPTLVRVERGDITLLEVDAFVFYATHDLKLGTGIGGAIAVRGGPKIQQELDAIGRIETTAAVISNAGELKAKQIIHAVGPRFQEPELEPKLAATIRNVLRLAEEHGLQTLALPAMGCGFYGIALELCARVLIEELHQHLQRGSQLKEVRICVVDSREHKPFADRLAAVA